MRHGVAPLAGLVVLAGSMMIGHAWAAEEHPHAAKDNDLLATVIVTGVVPQSPLTFVTDPKLPRQPVPASDGADYLKTIPGFGVIRNGGTNGDPVLRGMFGSRLNILTNDGSMPGACVGDFILFTYISGGMMGPMSSVNQVDAEVRGGEAGVEFRPLSRWQLGATLAYSWAENRDTGAALPQIPPLDARFTVAYDNSRWSAGVLLRVVDGQDRVAPGQGNVVGQDLGKTAGFAVLSMNGAYRLSSQISLAAGIDNLLDRTYAEHLNLAGSADFGYPAEPVRIDEPGRTAWLKLVWNMNRK